MNLPQLNPAFAKRLLLKVREATTILDPIENMPQTMNIVSHFTSIKGVYKEFNGTVTKKKNGFWYNFTSIISGPQEKTIK